jgi:putative transposase
MGSFFLQKGLVIRRRGQDLEYDSRSGDELYFEDPKTGQKVTLKEHEFWGEHQTRRLTIVDAFSTPTVLEIPSEMPDQQFRNLADLSQKYQDDAERKHTYIDKLREAGISKGQKFLIADQAKRIAEEIADPLGVPGTSTISRWWNTLEKSNFEVYAVVSGHANRERGSPLDEDSEEFLQTQIDIQYLIPTRPPVTTAYLGYKKALEVENVSRAERGLTPLVKVAERTFYARIDARPKEDVMIARFGREAARKHFKMAKGHLPAEHPLDAVEIDHSPLNLHVIDDLSFLPLGRPWVTVIKDRKTGILLGFYISFQATGLHSIFGAIKHSLTSHDLAYELWPDIEHRWPAHGRGIYYVTDRGGDFLSPRYRLAIRSLGSRWQYCERRTPWHKGSIERFFGTLEQTFFEAMKGRAFSSLVARGDYDPVKDSVVRFSTLIYLLHKWAADYHNVFKHKRGQATSLDLWNEGIQGAPPPYPANIDELNIILGERHEGALSQEGVRFKWLTYADDALEELMCQIGKGKNVTYVVSPEDLGHIHVLNPQTNAYFPVPCTRPEYAIGLSLFQHKYLRREAGARLNKDSAVDTLMNTRARIQEVLAGEVDAKATATKVRLARIAGINSNAVLDGKQRSITTPFQGQQVNIPTPAATATESTPAFTNVPTYAWGV